MHRLLRSLATTCVVLVAAVGCVDASQQAPQPSGTAAPSPERCVDVPGPDATTPTTLPTALDLCQIDTLPRLTGPGYEIRTDYAADGATAECAAAASDARLVGALGFAATSLMPSSAHPVFGDVDAVVNVATTRDAEYAPALAAALDAVATLCDGAASATDTTRVPPRAEGWQSIAVGGELEGAVQHWRIVDGTFAFVQILQRVDPSVADAALAAFDALLAEPRDPIDAPDDCSASTDDDRMPAGIATPDALCAIDGGAWASVPAVRIDTLASGFDGDPACVDAGDSVTVSLYGGEFGAVRTGTDDALTQAITTVRAGTEDDAEIAAAFDALAAACVGSTVTSAELQQTFQAHAAGAWSAIRVTQTGTTEPSPADVDVHWILVDGAVAVVEAPTSVDPDAVQTVLDAQLALLEG